MIQMLVVYYAIISSSKYVKKKKIEKKLETKGGQHNGISLNLLLCYYISTILLISHYLEI